MEPPKFFRNDEVFVNGIIDNRTFNNTEGKIINITNKSGGVTNMSDKGICKTYNYIGTTYLIRFKDYYIQEWWCPPWNLNRIEKDIIKEEDIEWF
jgi:hypothetical protein